MKLTLALTLAAASTLTMLARAPESAGTQAPPPAARAGGQGRGDQPALAGLAGKIGHTDPSRMTRSRSHGSEGDMACQTLMRQNAIPLLNFVHRCEMTVPLGGVGHHFHNANEEMFVIFDGEAEFTIDGRASLLKGPIGAPVRMGHSHAIVNMTQKPIQFMNINVATVSAQYDAFNLDDSRVGASKDPKPVFMTMNLDKALLGQRQTMTNYHGGTGTVRFLRMLDPTVFLTNWSYVDHLIITPKSTDGAHVHPHVGEVYYVLAGSGTVTVGSETQPIKAGDGVPVQPGEVHALANTGTEDLELMIIGVTTDKGKVDTEVVH